MESVIEAQVTKEQQQGIEEIESTQDKELVQAGEFSIESQEDLGEAREFVKHLKERIKKVKETFGAVKDANHKAWKLSVAMEAKFIDPLDTAIDGIKLKANTFLNAEEEKRLAEEARLRVEAEKDRERIEKALSKRIDKLFEGVKDDSKQLEILEEELTLVDADSPEAIMLDNKIGFLKRKIEGSITKAEAHKEAAEPTPSFVQPSVAPAEKTKGVTSKMKNVGTVVDKLALIKAIADGKLGLDIVEVSQPKINALVKAGMTVIPGVKITEERNTSFR